MTECYIQQMTGGIHELRMETSLESFIRNDIQAMASLDLKVFPFFQNEVLPFLFAKACVGVRALKMCKTI